MDNIEGKILEDAKFRELATEWARLVQAKARANIAQMRNGKVKGITTYKSGLYKGKTEHKLKTISYVLKSKDNTLDSISFKFPLHGIFVHYGVGRGQPTKEGKKRSKKVYIKRSPNDFLNDPIDKSFQKLSDMAAEYYGDKILFSVYGINSLR